MKSELLPKLRLSKNKALAHVLIEAEIMKTIEEYWLSRSSRSKPSEAEMTKERKNLRLTKN